MAKRPEHMDDLLTDWPYTFGDVAARKVKGRDSRTLLQMRVDMGILQLETHGRPDGEKPEGFDTYYDYLMSLAFEEGEDFVLDEQRCAEIDREFVQYYHRRVCWLALRDFKAAAADAEHTLSLMDFSTAHAPSDDWAHMHEQYRAFVLFHRTQASAMAELDAQHPGQAVDIINEGLQQMRTVFIREEEEEEFEDDELVGKLRELKAALTQHFELEPPLAEQLAKAIAQEQYELAAELRDRMKTRRPQANRSRQQGKM